MRELILEHYILKYGFIYAYLAKMYENSAFSFVFLYEYSLPL